MGFSGFFCKADLSEAAGKKTFVIDLEGISRLDTAGAWLIVRLIKDFKRQKITCTIETPNKGAQVLFSRARKDRCGRFLSQRKKSVWHNEFVEFVGRRTLELVKNFCDVLAYLGKIAVLWASAISPKRELKWVPYRASHSTGWSEGFTYRGAYLFF